MNIATFIYKHRKSLVLGVFLLVLILLATAPLYITESSIIITTSVFMYITLAVSWAMFSGPTRYLSLATAAFVGVGIYTTFFLYGREEVLPLPAVIVIGGLFSSCLALIVGSATLRLRGIYFAIFTFGLTEFFRRLMPFFESPIPEYGFIRNRIDAVPAYHIVLIILVALMVTAYLIRRSRYGLALEGIGECEEAASHTGVNVTRVKILTFAISAFFMGAIGAVMATRMLFVDPAVVFQLNYSFEPVLMAILGGVGQLYGPVIGATIFSPLYYWLAGRFPFYKGYWLICGLTLIVVVVFLPGGLASLIERGRHRLGELITEVRERR